MMGWRAGAYLMALCGIEGLVNGTRFTAVNVHLPVDDSGITLTGLAW
jgi:hypothetical protein